MIEFFKNRSWQVAAFSLVCVAIMVGFSTSQNKLMLIPAYLLCVALLLFAKEGEKDIQVE